jgi:hypothetical protein
MPDTGRRRLARVERLAWWLDEAFAVPGTSWRIGLDGLLGLLFGAGDTVTFLAGGYALWVGIQLDAPKGLLARMLCNLLLDYLVGLVPLVGDLFDFRIKAHRRNAVLLRAWLEDRGA